MDHQPHVGYAWGHWSGAHVGQVAHAPRWSLLGLPWARGLGIISWLGQWERQIGGPRKDEGWAGSGAGHLPASPAAVLSGCPSRYTHSHRLRSLARHLGPSPQRSRLLGASPGPHWWLSRPSGRQGSAIWPPAPGTTCGIRSYRQIALNRLQARDAAPLPSRSEMAQRELELWNWHCMTLGIT